MADRLVVLREGEVQQIGTPEELHDKPVNWYVADFMGYRNILDMTVSEVAADGRVRVTQGELTLWGSAQSALPVGTEVRVAIRPDDFVVETDTASALPNSMATTVGVVEYLGREYVFDCVLPGVGSVHVKTPTHPGAGTQLRIGVPAERVLVYPTELASQAATKAAV